MELILYLCVGGLYMPTFEDSAVYEYCELLYEELNKNDSGYYPSKHDGIVFQQAAAHFNISEEKVHEIYREHSKLAVDIEMNKISKLPPAIKQKIIKNRARNIMLNNRDLPFHKIEGEPSEPLPLATSTLETEYKDSLMEMAKRGWTIPLMMGLNKFNEIVLLIHDDEKIDAYFLKFYENKNFKKMCDSIANNLQNPAHKKQFDECVEAYNGKLFSICVTSLAPIIEGLLSLYGDNPNDTRMMRICQYNADEAILKKQKIKSLSWLSMSEFIKMLFHKSDFDQTEPDNFNRHWLLHGRTSKIGKQIDCLRLFNAISTLAIIKTFEEKIQ